MPHVDEGTLHALLDGALRAEEPERAATAEAHIDACADCAARLEAAAELRGRAAGILGAVDAQATPDFEEVLVRAGAGAGVPAAAGATHAGQTPPHRHARQARWTRRVAWAASVVLALGTGYLIRDRIAPPAPGPAADMRQTSAAPQSTAAAAPDTRADGAADGGADGGADGRVDGRVEGGADGGADGAAAGGAERAIADAPERQQVVAVAPAPPAPPAAAPRRAEDSDGTRAAEGAAAPEPEQAMEAIALDEIVVTGMPAPANSAVAPPLGRPARSVLAGPEESEPARVRVESLRVSGARTTRATPRTFAADAASDVATAAAAAPAPAAPAPPAIEAVDPAGVAAARAAARRALGGPHFIIEDMPVEAVGPDSAGGGTVLTVQRLTDGRRVELRQRPLAAVDEGRVSAAEATAPAPGVDPLHTRLVVVRDRQVVVLSGLLPGELLLELAERLTGR